MSRAGWSHVSPIAPTPSPLRRSRWTTSQTGARLNAIATSCRASTFVWFADAT